MSLFQVNRYQGEDEELTASAQSRSQALLAKLQQKAKDKQNQKPPSTETLVAVDEQKTKRRAQSDDSHDSQMKKQRKAEPLTSSILDSVEEPVKEQKQKKKKKEKLKEVQSAPLSDTSVPVKDGKDEERENKNLSSVPSSFTVLGGFENKPIQKVHRVLPQWLAQPDLIQRDIKNNLVPISEVQYLSAQLLSKLRSHGVEHFFPVQAEVIPAILESAQQGVLIGRGGYKPRDLCVSAPTGSGKTLAFVIPVIQVSWPSAGENKHQVAVNPLLPQVLMERVVCEVRALAVLPTKELAQQVCKVFKSYAEGTSLRVVMLAGQRSLAAEQASLSECRGGARRSLADIVVATPGRLVDHINENSGLNLEHLRFLIIDEADRMIDGMHQSWLSQVVKSVYRSGDGAEKALFRRTEPAFVSAASLSPPQMPLQKLLFSATLTQNPEKLQQLGLHQPRLFSSVQDQAAGAKQTQERFDFPQGLTEYYMLCTLSKKPLYILHLILRMKLHPILCFTNSREAAHRLYRLVQLFGGIQAAEFSSRLSPAERKKTLKQFEQGKIQLLISTDAAARGIDISGVKYVVNYDAPQYIRTYIHRIGRTARAGKAGLAFTFLLKVQLEKFLPMVAEAGSPGIQKHLIKAENFKGLEARYEQVLQELATVIKEEQFQK
ncbi:ATP-dependent RNA helicase DDX51 isoform X1 [Synchiropus splendidus]|uniref:ATP-dependent RNA helicase DDX51 isoform X1 n=1 Tax=Synchiropus splendidus TaxID=270530 RepID=UPI00237ED28B|nr:ATP-dependent RNA helicase DDX51 isoform X1 [Synchiropus splendidus]